MILVGNQRGHASNLALHLMKDENEHVLVHEISGFASDDLFSALRESEALSLGTRCKQHLFSMSFNPPAEAKVSTETFQAAINRAEETLGLVGQPRIIVFHEKEGRRHAHAVWSRIDAQEMKAIPMSFSKNKMQVLARELYLEHDWTMPPGLRDKSLSDPKNFTLAEWQQAKRSNRDPREIKAAIQNAWAQSDNAAALVHALEERGFKLARGDRRGHVLVDTFGEVHSLARRAGVKSKDVRARLGDPSNLPSVAETRADVAMHMQEKLDAFQSSMDVKAEERRAKFKHARNHLIKTQREARQVLFSDLEERRIKETTARQARFTTGLRGLWDRLRGEHRRIREQNIREAAQSAVRDKAERDALIFRQLAQRRTLQQRFDLHEEFYAQQSRELSQDHAHYQAMRFRDASGPKP